MKDGHADIGRLDLFEPMLGSKNLTMMGWVRIDSVKVLNHGGFNIMTFLGTSGVTGIRINQRRLEYAQNGRVRWTINDNNMKLSDDDLGKWIHLAVVKQPGANGLRMYLNGAYVTARLDDEVTTAGLGAFHLGKNSPVGQTNNDDNFSGAFDQVAVWNRALSHEEVLRYMSSAVPLNDPDLLCYLNMDYFDENSRARDIYSMAEIKTYPTPGLGGTVSFGEISPVPFDSRSVVACSSPDAAISLSFPSGNREAWVTTFRGTPYCYLNHDFQQYSALNQEFYGITFNNRVATAPSADDNVTLTYRHRSILGDEHLAVAMRRTGTSGNLAGFIPATTVEPGVATFDVPATYLYQPSELMFFTYPGETGEPESARPAILHLSFPQSLNSQFEIDGDVPELELAGDETSLPVVADVMALSRNYDAPVRVRVNETNYATASQDEIDFSQTENRFNINLDLDKMDKYGINPITINLEGATSNELRLNVRFEPYVLLTLENGDHRDIVTPGQSNAPRRDINRAAEAENSGNNTFRSTSPVANLDINAQLVQGWLPEGKQVKLEVITDLDNSLNIGGGNLLKDDTVAYESLEHHASDQGTMHEGWNLIGNPYLANINLTKSQNVDFDPESVTKFLYQCDPLTGNYNVFDMTRYDASHQIHPFQSYFVQVMAENADFKVTPIAKEQEPTKRTRSYKVNENRTITFGLSDADDKSFDRVSLNFDEDADGNFITNEDAPKMWNITGSSPELFAMTSDGKETAVTTTPNDRVTMGVKSPDARTLRLVMTGIHGLDGKKVTVTDNANDEEWIPSDEAPYYEFTASPGVNNDRFTVAVDDDDILSGVDTNLASRYSVTVDNHVCTVSGLSGDATIRIFTPSGINIINQYVTTPSFSAYLEDGFFLVVICENGKEFTSKILVK